MAGAGYNVVKHGNYGATSVSGASNVMEQHGVKFTNDIDKLRTSMDTCHIAYLHAPLFNPALKAVAPGTEEPRRAQLLQYARPAGQPGHAYLPIVRRI